MNDESRRDRWRVRIVGFAILSLAFVGCQGVSGTGESAETRKRKSEHVADMEKLSAKRAESLAKIRKLTIPQLVVALDQDARAGRESFNSLSFREVTTNRKEEGLAVFEAVRARKQPTHISLLAVREVYAEGYNSLPVQLRSDVLVGALGSTRSFNEWGLPHLYWENAARAIIALGDAAVPGLKKLLSDRTTAMVWGSEEVQESEAYGYRRCDYALALIRAIRKQSVKDLPRSPDARDELIRKILAE